MGGVCVVCVGGGVLIDVVCHAARRRFFSTVGAAALTAAPLVVSAKSGQFGKVEIFGYASSSPYVEGGPKAGKEATFGLQKSKGPILAANYESDVDREKASFVESSRRISGLQPKLDSKTWWFLRDELRIQAYNMRGSMLALNKVSKNSDAAAKAYKKYWQDVEKFDLACTKKVRPITPRGPNPTSAALLARSFLLSRSLPPI